MKAIDAVDIISKYGESDPHDSRKKHIFYKAIFQEKQDTIPDFILVHSKDED